MITIVLQNKTMTIQNNNIQNVRNHLKKENLMQ